MVPIPRKTIPEVLGLIAALLPFLLGPAFPSEVGTARIEYSGPKVWENERAFFGSLTDEQVQEAVEEAVRNALGPSGLAAIIRPGDRVALKPNIVQAREGMGDVTDVRVVRALSRLVREAAGAGSRLTVVESTLGAGLGEYRKAGYDQNGDFLLDGVDDVPLVDLDTIGESAAMNITALSPKLFWGELWLPDILRTRAQALAGPPERQDVYSDILISAAVLKNHSNAAVTCALKNRVGCAPMAIYGNRSAGTRSIHKDAAGRDCLNEAIVDLNRSRPCDLVLIDCLTGHIHGPSLFKVPTTDDLKAYIIFPFQFVASADAVAADVVASILMGYDPASVRYLALAGTHGLGTHLPKEITVTGPSAAALRAELRDRYSARGKYPFPTGYGSVNVSRLIADSLPPSKAEIVPFQGGSVPLGRTVPVRVAAADNSGVVRIELFVGAQRVGVLGSDPAKSLEGTIPWDPPTTGEFTLKAIAYDSAFNEKESAPLAVGVIPARPFIRGDPNGDGEVDIADALRILFFLFLSEEPLACAAAGDADSTGSIDIADAVSLLNHLFIGGPAPAAPFPGCGEDPSPGILPCAQNPCEG